MIETTGSFQLRNGHGSGMIRLVWKSAPPKGGELSPETPTHSWVGQRRRISCFVAPGLKVHCLGRANADQDSQHFDTGDPLRQRGIAAVATLFDSRHVESRRVGNCLG